jgi:Ni/Co efflux regulator RcnB
MKSFPKVLALSTLALTLTLTGGVAFAQDHPDHPDNTKYVHHPEWKKGRHIEANDWSRGDQVDWHAHHLRQPPSGYEWREIDGNFVLASSNGVISTVVVAH